MEPFERKINWVVSILLIVGGFLVLPNIIQFLIMIAMGIVLNPKFIDWM